MAITKVTNRVLDDSSVGVAQLSSLAVPTKLGSEIGAFNFRNKIINGNFDIWQRGTSFTGINNNTFTADRWTNTSSTATSNKNISRQLLGASDLPYLEAGLRYFLRGSYTSGTNPTEFAIATPLELNATGSAAPFKVGQTYTLSFYAKCASANTFRTEIQYRDTSGLPTNNVSVLNTTQALTTSWARYSITFTMLAPNATNTSLIVIFANSTVPANTNIDITGVQLEEGPVATPFEQRPIGLELSLCQRYYCVVRWDAQTPSGGSTVATIRYPVTMRGTPTDTLINAGTIGGTITTIVNAAGSTNRTNTGTYAQIIGTSSGAFVINREIGFDAEL